jgi:hypothetical protein
VNENIELQLGNIESAAELQGQANQLQAAGNQFKSSARS